MVSALKMELHRCSSWLASCLLLASFSTNKQLLGQERNLTTTWILFSLYFPFVSRLPMIFVSCILLWARSDRLRGTMRLVALLALYRLRMAIMKGTDVTIYSSVVFTVFA